MKFVYLTTLSLTIAFAGCNPTPDFDSIPKIEYAGISKTEQTDPVSGKKSDRVTVTVSFQDKEGDLGAAVSEYNDPAFISQYDDWGNYELITVIKELNGELTEMVFTEDKPKWFPVMKTDKGTGAIKGKLDLNFDRRRGNSMVMIEQKFKIRIRDRALHYSNQIETDFITLPGYR